MNIKVSKEIISKIVGYISVVIFLIPFLLILNWFFHITSYQRFEGLPLLMANLTGPLGIVVGLV